MLLYQQQHNISLISVPCDITLGKQLKNCTEVNKVLEAYVSELTALEIYTDDSKIFNSSSTGAACIFPQLNIRKKSIHSKASVYTAEYVAIDDALDIVKQNPYYNFLIFPDSLSTLQALKSNKIKISTNQYIYIFY